MALNESFFCLGEGGHPELSFKDSLHWSLEALASAQSHAEAMDERFGVEPADVNSWVAALRRGS